MLDILFEHEVDKRSAKEIGDDYGFNRHTISEVAHFVRAVLFNGVKKGQVDREEFERLFATEELPEKLLKALTLVSEYGRFNKGKDPEEQISELNNPPSQIYWWHLRSVRTFFIQFDEQLKKH